MKTVTVSYARQRHWLSLAWERRARGCICLFVNEARPLVGKALRWLVRTCNCCWTQHQAKKSCAKCRKRMAVHCWR